MCIYIYIYIYIISRQNNYYGKRVNGGMHDISTGLHVYTSKAIEWIAGSEQMSITGSLKFDMVSNFTSLLSCSNHVADRPSRTSYLLFYTYFLFW